MEEMSYYTTGIIFNGIPALLLAIHWLAKDKYQKDFDNFTYFHSILCITVLATLGSFSKDELIEFGFHFLATEPKWSYFALKLSFYFWSIVLLPSVLDKFFKNRSGR